MGLLFFVIFFLTLGCYYIALYYSLDIDSLTDAYQKNKKILALLYMSRLLAGSPSVMLGFRMLVQSAKPALPIEHWSEQ